MKILLTNDDGIHAEGLGALFTVLSHYHEVYALAPDREQSGCSNSFTIRHRIAIKKVADRRFSVAGFPADCVILGINGSIIPQPDLVISGINHGPNLGYDVYFSGTVAGARTAGIMGKPAIAVSIDSYHRPSLYFIDCAESIAGMIDAIASDGRELSLPPLLLNVNYPDLPRERIKGIVRTQAGRRVYTNGRGATLSSDEGDEIDMIGEIESEFHEGSDIGELAKGYVTVTPLSIDPTDHSYPLPQGVFHHDNRK